MDLVIFAGPVVLRPAWKVNWYGRDVRIAVVPGAGSDTFAGIAEANRDSAQRILPRLVQTLTKQPLEAFDQVAMSSFSAGWGLLEKVAQVPADRERLAGMTLMDSIYDGTAAQPPKPGILAMASRAAAGKALLVATTGDTTPGGFLSSRASFAKVAAELGKTYSDVLVQPRAPVPNPSGGMHQIGVACYWADYHQPGAPVNQGNDFTHAEQHDLTPLVWQAYLAPWLYGDRLVMPWAALAAGLLTGVVGAAGVRRFYR